MCGIVGYVARHGEAQPFLIEGLQRLEYRGYDSAGVATLDGSKLVIKRTVGKLSALCELLKREAAPGSCGIGHTRWATHGQPSTTNAHPHTDAARHFAVVHNGIIENYEALRRELQEAGHDFRTQTDTEVLTHLIARAYHGDLLKAVQDALSRAEGAYAIAVVSVHEPRRLVAARCGSPLVVGIGDGVNYVASDVPALAAHTKQVVYLNDFEIADITPDDVTVHTVGGERRVLHVQAVSLDVDTLTKGGYPHFMIKEMHEQPRIMAEMVQRRVREGEVVFEESALTDERLRHFDRVVLLGMGTARHACLMGRYYLERLARVPGIVDFASEYRYREPYVDDKTLVIAVSQSGETMDTLMAVRKAREGGATAVALVNAQGSTIDRECDDHMYLHAGQEIAVASTKAYCAMMGTLLLFALRVGQARGTVDPVQAKAILDGLQDVPEQLQWVLDNRNQVIAAADAYCDCDNFLYLGRGANFPNALEGALKLKELAYVHAEGYAAGEMKHGPIALVDETFPVVNIVARDEMYEKMVSAIQELRARKGRIISVATLGDTRIDGHSDTVIRVPDCNDMLTPFVTLLPLQLLAYYITLRRGHDVDQPRNLAKSVTVE